MRTIQQRDTALSSAAQCVEAMLRNTFDYGEVSSILGAAKLVAERSLDPSSAHALQAERARIRAHSGPCYFETPQIDTVEIRGARLGAQYAQVFLDQSDNRPAIARALCDWYNNVEAHCIDSLVGGHRANVRPPAEEIVTKFFRDVEHMIANDSVGAATVSVDGYSLPRFDVPVGGSNKAAVAK